MVIKFIPLILGAYLLGSVPAAYLAAKWSRGIDIRQYGSGSVGASNVVAVASKGWSIPVIVFDLGKGMAMVWVAQLLGLGIAQQVVVGLAAIIGHNWPVFLRFSGGRGALTTLGVVFILVPWLTPVVLIIAFGLAPIRQLALGVFLAILSLPIASWFFSQPLDIKEPLTLTLGFLAIFLILVIRRLAAPRAAIAASVSHRQLLVNRLLFDRDIRDREAWIHRAPPQDGSSEQPLGQQERQDKG